MNSSSLFNTKTVIILPLENSEKSNFDLFET